MPLFDPDPTTHSRPTLRWSLPALIAALTFLCAAAFASPVWAQEVPGTTAAAEVPTPTAVDPPSDPGPQPDSAPAPADTTTPEPPPPPEPVQTPPESQSPPAETPPIVPTEEPPATAPDRPTDSGGRDTASRAPIPSGAQAPAGFAVPAAPATVAPLSPTDDTFATTEPLGWDVYDDTLLAEKLDDGGLVTAFGGGMPPSAGGLAILGGIGPVTDRDKRGAAEPPARANATPAGGSGPGGPGPGPGPSAGMSGAGGGGAGIALMLLGLACAASMRAPSTKRAFRLPMATWRPSAYVPPIEQPG
jgi:outer membrane biosynthesis protein TonB